MFFSQLKNTQRDLFTTTLYIHIQMLQPGNPNANTFPFTSCCCCCKGYSEGFTERWIFPNKFNLNTEFDCSFTNIIWVIVMQKKIWLMRIWCEKVRLLHTWKFCTENLCNFGCVFLLKVAQQKLISTVALYNKCFSKFTNLMCEWRAEHVPLLLIYTN